jgi:hypothetical protein
MCIPVGKWSVDLFRIIFVTDDHRYVPIAVIIILSFFLLHQILLMFNKSSTTGAQGRSYVRLKKTRAYA